VNGLAAELEAVRQVIAVPNEPEQTTKPVIGLEMENQTSKPSQGVQGLTNAQLAELTNIPKSTIERWKAKLKAGESLSKVRNPEASKWELNKKGLWYLKGSI
jgi:hypothetical protein